MDERFESVMGECLSFKTMLIRRFIRCRCYERQRVTARGDGSRSHTGGAELRTSAVLISER